MIYLKSFKFITDEEETNFIFPDINDPPPDALIPWQWMVNMTCYSSLYPFKVFPQKKLECLCFDEPVTILYGTNGSGKTTALNIIAEKLHLQRTALYNKSPFFEPYLDACSFQQVGDIPHGSMMIASDDVFNYMLNVRAVNQEVDFNRSKLFEEYNKISETPMQTLFKMEDFDRNMVAIRRNKLSTSKFIKQNLMNNVRELSNGESALQYFYEKIQQNALYLLDEPENSLSPERQIMLAKYIEECAWACGCQFIIATHSPFLVSMKRTRIYNLDECPVTIRKWTELENIRCYWNLFKEHEAEF